MKHYSQVDFTITNEHTLEDVLGGFADALTKMSSNAREIGSNITIEPLFLKPINGQYYCHIRATVDEEVEE